MNDAFFKHFYLDTKETTYEESRKEKEHFGGLLENMQAINILASSKMIEDTETANTFIQTVKYLTANGQPDNRMDLDNYSIQMAIK